MLVARKVIPFQGHELLFRNPTKDDAAMLIQYLRTTCKETRFLSKEPEEVMITVDEEEAWIHQMNVSEHSMMLLAFLDGVFVGNCSFSGTNLLRQKHRVTMGIALYEQYTSMGIGTLLLEYLIEIIKGKGFQQIELEVSAENERAIHLYEKLGFRVYGTFPRYNQYKDGTYGDVCWMMKKLS